MDERWIQSIVVGNNKGALPGKRKGIEDPDADDQSFKNNMHKQATFELPLELTDNGIQLLKDAQVSMMCSMPPSRVNGRWSGTLEGKSSLGGKSNTATGSFSLDYKATSWSKLSLGMIRGHEPHHPLITIGGTLLRQGSALGVKFYPNPSLLHPPLMGHSMYSLSFRHVFPKSKWRVTSQLSRGSEMSVSMTNSKVEGGLGWNLRQPKKLQLRLGVRPTLSEHRRAHLYWHWKLGLWQVGASMVQSLHSEAATIGVGLRVASTRGLEWVFSWNRGDASIRIPVIISHTLSSATLGQTMYLSLVSFLFQEALADLWGWTNPSETITRALYETVVDVQKQKEDAELQRDLMLRQAKRKKRDEEEKEGLVIHEAVYRVAGGDAWDATAQLQFWVTQSSLSLPPMSKQELLGFYDITAGRKKDDDNNNSKTSPVESWWRGAWDDLWDATATDSKSKLTSNKGPVPTLTVRYDFKGQQYQMTVKDHEELMLPNPLATLLDKKE
jgi:hypothetical protein